MTFLQLERRNCSFPSIKTKSALEPHTWNQTVQWSFFLPGTKPLFCLPESPKSLFFLVSCNIHFFPLFLSFHFSCWLPCFFLTQPNMPQHVPFFLEADCFHYYLPSKYSYLLPERSGGCSVPACVPTEIIRKDLTGFTVPWMKTSNQILPLCEMSSLPQISQAKF